jgi:hypothetical protein
MLKHPAGTRTIQIPLKSEFIGTQSVFVDTPLQASSSNPAERQSSSGNGLNSAGGGISPAEAGTSVGVAVGRVGSWVGIAVDRARVSVGGMGDRLGALVPQPGRITRTIAMTVMVRVFGMLELPSNKLNCNYPVLPSRY